jgi:hypothetical protein
MPSPVLLKQQKRLTMQDPLSRRHSAGPIAGALKG